MGSTTDEPVKNANRRAFMTSSHGLLKGSLELIPDGTGGFNFMSVFYDVDVW
jgi:hypothetical protein